MIEKTTSTPAKTEQNQHPKKAKPSVKLMAQFTDLVDKIAAQLAENCEAITPAAVKAAPTPERKPAQRPEDERPPEQDSPQKEDNSTAVSTSQNAASQVQTKNEVADAPRATAEAKSEPTAGTDPTSVTQSGTQSLPTESSQIAQIGETVETLSEEVLAQTALPAVAAGAEAPAVSVKAATTVAATAAPQTGPVKTEAPETSITDELLKAISQKVESQAAGATSPASSGTQAKAQELATAALQTVQTPIAALAALLDPTKVTEKIISATLFGKALEASADKVGEVKATPGVTNTGSGSSNSAKSESSSTARRAAVLSKVNMERTMEKVESAMKEVVKSQDGKSLSFRLDPPSMGSVKVDVSLRDGVLHARISAESQEVNAMLREKSSEMQQMLRKLGLSVDKVTVSVGSDTASFNQNPSTTHKEKSDFAEAQKNILGANLGQVEMGKTATVITRRAVEDHWVA